MPRRLTSCADQPDPHSFHDYPISGLFFSVEKPRKRQGAGVLANDEEQYGQDKQQSKAPQFHQVTGNNGAKACWLRPRTGEFMSECHTGDAPVTRGIVWAFSRTLAVSGTSQAVLILIVATPRTDFVILITLILVGRMKAHNIVVTALLVLTFCSQVQGKEWIEQCKIEGAKDRLCRALYVSATTTRAFSEPRLNSGLVREFHLGETVAIHWEASRRGPRDWVAYGSSGYTGTLGWIPKASLTSLRNFERIKKCWPIKTIMDDDVNLGDYLFSVSLSKNGAGYSTTSDEKVDVWRNDSLIFIGNMHSGIGDVYSSKMEDRGLALYNPRFGYRVKKIEYHFFKKSENCTQGSLRRPFVPTLG